MRRLLSSCAFSAALLSVPLTASAQLRPERPYRGLFASGTADATHELTVNASFGGGYDNDLLADAQGSSTISNEVRRWRGGLGAFSGGLLYSLQAASVAVDASLGSTLRYYPSLNQRYIHGTSGSLSVSVPFGARTSASAGATVAHQPYTFANLIPSQTPSQGFVSPAPNLDVAVGTAAYTTYQASLNVGHQLASRTSLSGGVNHTESIRGSDGADGYRQQAATATLTHRVGRGLSLRAGYTHSVAHHELNERLTRQAIDAGVDYGRSLSFSRRSTLSFGTGTTMVSADGKRQFRLTGGARFNHEIGRTWNAYVNYGRQVSLQERFLDPVISDGVSTGIGGLISRRLTFNAAVGGVVGSVGAEEEAPGFDTVNGSASLSLAVTRFVNVGVTYAYYHHQFDHGAVLPGFIEPQMDRQSIHASVSLWAPLVSVTRRTNASR